MGWNEFALFVRFSITLFKGELVLCFLSFVFCRCFSILRRMAVFACFLFLLF